MKMTNNPTKSPIHALEGKHLPTEFGNLSNPPQKLFYKGHLNLLKNTHKIAIVGTRKPNPYTRTFVATLANKISSSGGVVVSGGALGVDILAHTNAFPNTIMLSPSSLEILYPKSNAGMITRMMEHALVLSEYERNYMPHKYSFLDRNRLVIALAQAVIIPQADLYSGSMQSAKIALELGKSIYVLPHRIGESEGTNTLLKQNQARAIYNIDEFIRSFFDNPKQKSIDHTKQEIDEILKFCALAPSFEEALEKFGSIIYEYELEGKIIREAGIIRPIF